MVPRPQPDVSYGQVSSRSSRSEIRRSVPTPTSAAQATNGRTLQSPIRNSRVEPSPSSHWAQPPPISPSGEDSPAGVTAGAPGSTAFPRSAEIPRRFNREKARNVPARGTLTRFQEEDVMREAARLTQGGSGGRRWNVWFMGLVTVLLAGVLACRLGSNCDSIASLVGDLPIVVSSKAELRAALEVAGIRAREKQLEKAWSALSGGDSDGRGRGSPAARLVTACALLTPGVFCLWVAFSAAGIAAGFALGAISGSTVRWCERERVAGANRARCAQAWDVGNQGGDGGGG